ncbi:MAG: DUF308 domain-containing protein [Pseudomonadota bacterium]
MSSIDSDSDTAQDAAPQSNNKRRWTPLLLGGLSILAGLLAITFPLIASLAAGLYFAFMVGTIGVFQVIDAARHQDREGTWLTVLTGALAVLTAVLIVTFPVLGLLSLTLLIGSFFFADALLRLGLAFRGKAPGARVSLVVGGVLSLLIAAAVLIGFPSSAAYVIGILWGVHAIFVDVGMAASGWITREA